MGDLTTKGVENWVIGCKWRGISLSKPTFWYIFSERHWTRPKTPHTNHFVGNLTTKINSISPLLIHHYLNHCLPLRSLIFSPTPPPIHLIVDSPLYSTQFTHPPHSRPKIVDGEARQHVDRGTQEGHMACPGDLLLPAEERKHHIWWLYGGLRGSFWVSLC